MARVERRRFVKEGGEGSKKTYEVKGGTSKKKAFKTRVYGARAGSTQVLSRALLKNAFGVSAIGITSVTRVRWCHPNVKEVNEE